MHQLTSSLFSLDNLTHVNLIQTSLLPWEILKHLKPYVDSYERLGTYSSDIPSSAILINPELISIGEGVLIGPHVSIVGPCIIGNHCEIRSNAFVRAYSVLEDHVIIGHCTECKSSLFLPHSKAPHFNYVGDSVIGSHVNLGAGVTCANLRLDHKSVSVITEDGERIDTHLEKLGSILGDHCQIGCQSVLNPGIILKRKTLIRPLTSVSRSNIKHFLWV